MSQNYTPTQWNNNNPPAVNADNLNHLEQGVAAVDAAAQTASAAAQTASQTFATNAVNAETTRAQNAENLLAPKASPTFTGTVIVPTPTAGDSSTKAASTAFVAAAVGAVSGGSGSSSEPLGTPELLAAIDRIGVVDRQASMAQHRVDYEDTAVFNEPWSANPAAPWVQKNNNDVVVSTTGQLINGSGGGHAAFRPFAAGLTSRFRICSSLTITASGSGTGVCVGVTKNTSNDPTVLADWSVIGLNPSGNPAIAFAYDGNNVQHPVSNIGANVTASDVPAGTYRVCIVGDEQGVSLTVYNAARTIEATRWITRAQAGAITGIVVYNDSNQSGAYVGPVGARLGSPSVAPRASVEGVAYTPATVTLPSGRITRFELPSNYDARKPVPLVLWSHGFSWGYQDTSSNAGPAGLAAALLAAGFAVANTDNGGDTWGNATSLAAILETYQYFRAHYPLGPIILAGQSLGGLPVANAVARRAVPCAGVMLFEANLNLAWNKNTSAIWSDGSYGPSFRNAYGIASDGSNYATVTAGYDPMLQPASAFRGVPWLLAYSNADGLVDPTQHAQLMQTKLTGNVRELDMVVTSGAHNAVSQFPTAEPVAFAQRCIAA